MLGNARNSCAAGERLLMCEGDHRIRGEFASAIHLDSTAAAQTSNTVIKIALCKVVKVLRKRTDGDREGMGAAFRRNGVDIR
ncbi:hypothetical protein ABIE89_005782 [Bradyrhizobium niftali]|uniref:hypothetical protein n=1 Tax=Bradyrhizobium niftali TaxID=2560055 RepID=UPI00383984B2